MGMEYDQTMTYDKQKCERFLTLPNPVGFPVVIAELNYIIKTERDVSSDPSELELEIIVQQEDKILLNEKTKINFEDKAFNNLAITIGGLVIEKPAPLVFICKKGEDELSKYTINVKAPPSKVTLEKEASST
jgi:predicted NUDIX family phosphoesterase